VGGVFQNYSSTIVPLREKEALSNFMEYQIRVEGNPTTLSSKLQAMNGSLGKSVLVLLNLRNLFLEFLFLILPHIVHPLILEVETKILKTLPI
jgi:hypothetical protein